MASQKLNNYNCRYCDFNSTNESFDILKDHYEQNHPVSTSLLENENIEYYQNNRLIAVDSYQHKHCCLVSCPNNQTAKIKKKLRSLAICVNPGSNYAKFDEFFEEEDYNNLTKPIIVCVNVLDEVKDSNQVTFERKKEQMCEWIEKYGLMMNMSMSTPLNHNVNKNYLILNRVPKIKDQKQIKLNNVLYEKETTDVMNFMTQAINVGLVEELKSRRIESEKRIEKSKRNGLQRQEKEGNKDKKIRQLEQYIRSTGCHVSYDGDGNLIVLDEDSSKWNPESDVFEPATKRPRTEKEERQLELTNNIIEGINEEGDQFLDKGEEEIFSNQLCVECAHISMSDIDLDAHIEYHLKEVRNIAENHLSTSQ